MKIKILSMLSILTVVCIGVNGQNADANAVKTTEVIVNGIPYSQYKAQQEALKQQQQADNRKALLNNQEKTLNAADIKPAAKPAKVVDEAAEARKITNATKDAVAETKPAPVNVTKTASAAEPASAYQTQVISAGTVTTPVPAVKAVEPAVSKVQEQKAEKAAPGIAESFSGISIGKAPAEQQAATAEENPVKMPEQKLSGNAGPSSAKPDGKKQN